MNTHIVCNPGNIASRFPRRSSNFPPSHSHPHPHPSNENIVVGRNRTIWPARSMRPRLVFGLHVQGGGKPSFRGCADV
jgi:hypothetical protein